MLNSFEPQEFVELARRIEGDDDVDVVELANFIVTLARSKVRRVRTPEGSRFYGLPIGAIITRDAITRAKLRFPKQKPPAGASKVSRKKISDFKPKTRTANKKLVKALKSDPAFTKPKLITPKGDKKVKVKNSEFNVPSGSRVFRAKDDDSYAVVRTPGYDLIGVTDKGVAFDIKGESEQILNDRFDDFKKDDPEFSSETIGKQSSKDLGPDADVDQADGADGADKSKKKDDYDQYESYEDVPEYLGDERIKRIVDSLDDSGVDPEVTRELDTQLRKLDNETKKKWEAARSPEAAKSKQNTAETEKIGGLDNGKRKEADRPEREAGQLGGTSDRSSGEGGVPPKVSSDVEGPGGQKDGDTERREDRGSDSSRVLTVGGREVRTVGAFNPSEEDAKRLQDEGLPTPTLYELSGPEGVEAFHAAMEGLKNEGNPYAASVYVYSPEEYAGMRLFVNEDGKSGLALKGDELVSGFSYRDSKFKGSVASNLSVAIELGGRRADCFDTVLPDLYAAAGLVPVARMKFDDEYAPDGWDYDLYEKFNGGRPDVVFLAYDKDRVGEKYDPTEGRYVTEYDDGALAQKDALQGVKAPEAKPETLKTRDQSDTTGKDPESMSPEQLDDVIADFEDFKAAGGSLTEAGKERLDSLTKERDRRTKEPVVRPEKTSKPSQPLKVSNKPFGDQRISDDEMRKQGISAGKGEFSVETVERNDILNARIGDKFIHRNALLGKESLWGLEEDGKLHRLSGDGDDVSVTPEEFAALLDENPFFGKSEVFEFSGNRNNKANRPSPKPGDVASAEWAKDTKAGSVANDGSGLVSTKNENGKWDTPLGEFPEDFIGPSDIENDDSVVIQDGPNDDGRPVGASSKVTNAADVDAVKPGSSIVLSGKDNVLERKQDGNFEADIDGLKFDLPAKDIANSGEVASGRAWHVPDQDLDTPVAKNLKTGDKIPNLVDAREQSPGSKLVLDQQDGTKRSYTVLPDGQLFDDETKKSLPAVVLRDSILGGRVTLGEVAPKGADLPEVPAKKITNVSDYEVGDVVVDYKHLRDMKPGQQATILVKSSKNGGKSLPVVLTRTDDTKDNAGFMFLVGKRGAGYNSFGENNASIFQAIADGRFYFGDITTLPGSKQPEVINSPWDTSPDIKLWEDGPNVSEKDLWDFINAQVYSRAMQGSYYNVDLLPKDSPFRSQDLRKKFSVLAIDKYSLHDEKGRIVVPARHKPAMIRLAADKLGLEYTDPGSALIPEDLELSDFNEKVTVGKWLRKRGSLYNPAEANMGSEQIEVSKADIKIALSVLDNMLVPDSGQDPDKILKRDMAMRGSPLQDMNTSVAIAAYFGMRRSKDGVLTYEIGRQYDKQNNKALLRQMLLEQMEGREPGYYGLPEDEVYVRKGSTYVNYSTLSRPAVNADNDMKSPNITEAPATPEAATPEAMGLGPAPTFLPDGYAKLPAGAKVIAKNTSVLRPGGNDPIFAVEHVDGRAYTYFASGRKSDMGNAQAYRDMISNLPAWEKYSDASAAVPGGWNEFQSNDIVMAKDLADAPIGARIAYMRLSGGETVYVKKDDGWHSEKGNRLVAVENWKKANFRVVGASDQEFPAVAASEASVAPEVPAVPAVPISASMPPVGQPDPDKWGIIDQAKLQVGDAVYLREKIIVDSQDIPNAPLTPVEKQLRVVQGADRLLLEDEVGVKYEPNKLLGNSVYFEAQHVEAPADARESNNPNFVWEEPEIPSILKSVNYDDRLNAAQLRALPEGAVVRRGNVQYVREGEYLVSRWIGKYKIEDHARKHWVFDRMPNKQDAIEAANQEAFNNARDLARFVNMRQQDVRDKKFQRERKEKAAAFKAAEEARRAADKAAAKEAADKNAAKVAKLFDQSVDTQTRIDSLKTKLKEVWRTRNAVASPAPLDSSDESFRTQFDHFDTGGSVFDAPRAGLWNFMLAREDLFDMKGLSDGEKHHALSDVFMVTDRRDGSKIVVKTQPWAMHEMNNEALFQEIVALEMVRFLGHPGARAVQGWGDGYAHEKGDALIMDNWAEAIGVPDAAVKPLEKFGSIGVLVKEGPDPDGLVRLGLFDYFVGNERDRHVNNVVGVEDPNGGARVALLDFGLAFNGSRYTPNDPNNDFATFIQESRMEEWYYRTHLNTVYEGDRNALRAAIEKELQYFLDVDMSSYRERLAAMGMSQALIDEKVGFMDTRLTQMRDSQFVDDVILTLAEGWW